MKVQTVTQSKFKEVGACTPLREDVKQDGQAKFVKEACDEFIKEKEDEEKKKTIFFNVIELWK